MKAYWTAKDSSTLGQYFTSYLQDIREGEHKDRVVHGLHLFIEFPKVVRGSKGALELSIDALLSAYDNKELKEEVEKLANSRFVENPEAMLFAAQNIVALSDKVSDAKVMVNRLDQEYQKLFSGALQEIAGAAKALINKIDGKNYYPELGKTLMIDTAGILFPYLGSLKLLAENILRRTSLAKERIKTSSEISEAFLAFTDFMEEITKQMLHAQSACREDASKISDFVSKELPGLLKDINQYKL